MSNPLPTKRPADVWVSACLTAVLVASAALALGYRLTTALQPEDADTLETTMALPVARQLVEGPWGLYGPFDARNKLVLIHAPLYYRLAAVVAWPLARAGLDPVSAAFAAGRALSLLGLLATLAATFRLTRVDAGSRKVGWWAVLLVLASPVPGGLPVMVRPDMVGIALQTLGALLVVSALQTDRPRAGAIVGACAAFGLAACVKQHFVATAAVATVLLVRGRIRGRIASKPIERGLLLAAAIVLAVYGAEEAASSGRMSQAVFGAAASVGRVRPADWSRVGIVFAEVTSRSVGLIALMASAALARLATRSGRLGRAFAAMGSVLVLSFVVLLGVWSLGAAGWAVVPLTIGEVVVLPLLILACALARRGSVSEGPVDAALWAFWAGEVALMAVLCRASTGAWTNYAVQGVVFAAVLTARALARALDGRAPVTARLLIACASLSVLIMVGVDIREVDERRHYEREAAARIVGHFRRPASEFFFVDRPGLNRLNGRADLAYDPWLYPVFESVGLAERRAIWLRHALTHGTVRFVVAESADPRVEGLDRPLPQLGFRTASRARSFYVWERTSPAGR